MLKHVMIFVLGLFLVGCGSPAAPTLTGDQVATSLRGSGLPTTGVQVFTAETDPNKLLGRPDQYTAKVSWFDSRVEPQDGLTSATVEVFSDAASLDARFKYTDAIQKSTSAFAQYIYRNDGRRVLLRLPHDLTAAQAAEYQRWLATL